MSMRWFKRSPHARHPGRQSGFSLIELGISLIIVGIIGVLVWRWVAASQAPLVVEDMQRELNEAQSALEGFVLANGRMPCPAADTGGNEACGNAAAVQFPWRTLRARSDLGQLRYGVNRGGGADLAVAPAATIAPDLNIDFSGVANPAQDAATAPTANTAATRVNNLIAEAQARRATANGLDWCRVLRRFGNNPMAANTLRVGNPANNMSVAFILVHPGLNGQYDGSNQAGGVGAYRYDFPGRAQDATFDDLSLAAGPTDLASRIGCTRALSAAQAAAQGAYAQYDNARVIQEYWAFRVIDVQASESDVQSAQFGKDMADLEVLIAIASQAVSLASAANTEGITAPMVIIAAANLASSIAAAALAAESLADAEDRLDFAEAKLGAMDAYAARVYTEFGDSLRRAIDLDIKGLNP
ncbi:type II secretion system protein [Hydrogenophaga sp. 5NK40-0174]|uniref:type II secretion system protein n=1 Tax=Hydrogenophaga sp. 5NK40-0174 TaxID=3127649 RepID=UPI00310C682C